MISAFTCPKCGHQDVVEEYKPPLPSHLLETNDPPLASEEHSLREMLAKSDFEREIALVEGQISHLQQVLGALTRRREKTMDSNLAAKGVLSAIRRVPAEIIGEIVLLVLSASRGSPKAATLNMKDGLWVYSQVCRLWRKEILSWTSQRSNVYIWYDWNQAKNIHSPAILTEILRRSQGRPLRLGLWLQVESQAKEMLAVAVKESERWKDVRLHLSGKMTVPLKLLQDRIPLLESLHIQLLNGSKGPSPPKNSPNLLDVPWTQLSHLSEKSGWNSLSDLIPKLNNVVSLATSSARHLPSGSTRQFQLDNLRTLDIAECHEPPSCLRVPALQELKVAADRLGGISDFIRQSPCHLTHLCIGFPYRAEKVTIDQLWNRANIEALFRVVPQLITLEFEWIDLASLAGVERQMAMKVTDLLTDMTLLPGLRRLVFDQTLLQLSLESLVAVVHRRHRTLAEMLFTGPHGRTIYRPATPDIVSAGRVHVGSVRQGGIKVFINAAKTKSTEFQIDWLLDLDRLRDRAASLRLERGALVHFFTDDSNSDGTTLDELWLLIMYSLSTQDLIPLVCVSRKIRRVSLDVLLHQDLLPPESQPHWMRYNTKPVSPSELNTRSENDADHFTLLPSMHPIIPYIDARRLTVLILNTGDRAETVEEIKELCEVARHNRIPELDICHSGYPSYLQPDPYSCVKVILPKVSLNGKYLILRDGYIQVSAPRTTPLQKKDNLPYRRSHSDEVGQSPWKILGDLRRATWNLEFPYNILFLPFLVVFTPFFLISFFLFQLVKSCQWGRHSQHWRVSKDLELSLGARELAIVELPFRSRISKFLCVDPKRITLKVELWSSPSSLATADLSRPCVCAVALAHRNQSWRQPKHRPSVLHFIHSEVYISFIQKCTIRRLSFGLESISDASVSHLSTFPNDAIVNLNFLSGSPAYIHPLMSSDATFDKLESPVILCRQRQVWRSLFPIKRRFG
ncbi:hypothetical protein C8J56DRAFT_1115734 [Mycena floridula]|nr:hypothetical protein C8J56DRAFT_1115734 [Mycena floridula]